MTAIKHILFPFDFSPQGLQAVPFVQALARRCDARITVFSVIPPVWELPPPGMRPLAGDQSRDSVQAVQDRLDHSFVDEFRGLCVERVVDGGDPAFQIAAFARNHQIDLIVMPTHGLGAFRRYLVGSVTAKVLHDATCPVWTAAHTEVQRSSELPRQVLCAVDGTPKSAGLLQCADAFCKTLDARLNVLHVLGPITDWPSLARERDLQERVRENARADIDKIQQAAGLTLPVRVAVGEIVDTVVEEARQEQADLVIIGRGSIGEPFGRLRTHAFGIVQGSPCPVLSV
jgi:nucleotide-binding universal stress UspA family protein